ncbi:MAG: phosphatidylserine decarboxylase [Xanthomonadales bacterium]|nr:phosphatidylserine decarboxylase [Gammaproteobacteria bacterium]MBT8072755.1 phosphatidylserine decarboxylase [Gammaproteobacteria bacterium]MBT8076093.1 phosphatidylserine decarboxylase [Gammaproteobacteria bacterium]NNK03597.1 phosphatidylserine decarboxylase [Xanthomonadales bacterium]NNK99176.1 phosphatidylserine decarboxylase [Xanthomonadales bacterium]
MKSVIERILAGFQYILPQHFLSRIVYAVMRCETKWVKNALIGGISRIAGINVSEALSPDPADYASFNAWFTRELKPGARLFDPDPSAFICPSDGRISETGRLQENRILQAKGKNYSLQDLLADDPVCKQLVDGYFSTIYLSPKDYHRVHMPLTGHLLRMIHVPGRLFSVAPYTVRQVPRLFARNERVISVFETDRGPLVMVLVGAMLVSSTETVWAGEVTPTKNKQISVTDYAGQDISLAKGDEMGRFNMGSTVILLMPPDTVEPLAELGPGDAVRVGQKLAEMV